MSYSFRGGIHPEPHKRETSCAAIETLPPPDEVVIPMSMHIGVPCEPIVKVGDYVRLGQKIGDSSAFVSAPIHASVSGAVKRIAMTLHPSGSQSMAVFIENDGKDELYDLEPQDDWESMSADALTGFVREAGIVGHGGAAFPTQVKIRSAIGKVDTLIINGAECEPYISSDHRCMLENTKEIVGGAKILLKMFPEASCLIAIESNKPDAIEAISKAIEKDSRMQVATLKTKYPQGSEKQLIKSVTGREVPPGALPVNAGCLVLNVETTAAIYRAIVQGRPVVRRVVTVAGSAVAQPKNLKVRVGTPLKYLIEAAGGFIEEPQKIIMGGPMMGLSQFSLDVPVIKGTNALLAFAANEDRRVEEPKCIRCGRCVQVCPMRLLPTYMYLYASKDNYEECDRLHVNDCMECGACTFECPGSLHLTQMFRVAKGKVMERRKK